MESEDPVHVASLRAGVCCSTLNTTIPIHAPVSGEAGLDDARIDDARVDDAGLDDAGFDGTWAVVSPSMINDNMYERPDQSF